MVSFFAPYIPIAKAKGFSARVGNKTFLRSGIPLFAVTEIAPKTTLEIYLAEKSLHQVARNIIVEIFCANNFFALENSEIESTTDTNIE